MNTRIVLSSSVRVVLIVVALLLQTTQAQNQASEETKRIDRLIGLAKVWGTVKYFHPYLAYCEIDWDKALVDAIPRVNAAKTPEEYRSALNQMLAVLNDKSTRAEIQADIKTAPANQPSSDSAKSVRTENGVLIVDAAQIAKAVTKDSTMLRTFVTNINQALPNVSGIVFDWRSSTKPNDKFETYYFETIHRQILTGLLLTFIGTPTQGANGDITFMVLPGNLPISFSGHDVRHADGRQLQRLGIQPHVKAAPTIRGMIEGRDEILEAAVKCLQKNLKK